MTAVSTYRDGCDHLLDELRRLDRLLAYHVDTWLRENGGVLDEFRGLYVSDEDVARALTRPSPDPDREAALQTALAEVDREISARRRASLDAGVDLRLCRLTEAFGLDSTARDVLLVALAPELDRRYETLFSYLQDDVTKRRPTVGLILALLCETERDRLAMRRLFAPRGPLVGSRLARLDDPFDAPFTSRTVSVDERVVDFLVGGDDVDRSLSDACDRSFVPVRTEDDPPGARNGSLDAVKRDAAFDADVQARLARFGARATHLLPYVYGSDEAARRSAAAAFVGAADRGDSLRETESGIPLLTADVARTSDEPLSEILGLTIREARLRGAAVHFTGFDALTRPQRDAAMDAFDSSSCVVVLSGTAPWQPERMPPNRTVVTVELTRPDYSARCRLWEQHLADTERPTDDGVDVGALATVFELTDAQIADAVRSATAAADGETLTMDDLLTACKGQSRSRLDSLARTVDPAYSWDDIVLQPSTLAHLREIAAQIRNRGTVYSDWGFEGKFSLGNGLVVLFSGPSGTGKTMATEVIANDLGLDLYKVDVASVVSKYIGETEKNLGRIFDEAERSNAVLLFDEADALFGKRSEVSDSHDRYANIEASYLLQRVEEYDGAVFLTTNFESNVDDAFGRRIHHSVAFSAPDREARAAIWRGIFPSETPLDDVDYEFLSSLSVTGGNIKNIALTAAFLAADEGRPVGMGHLACAARREFEKIGKLIDPDRFEPYLDPGREDEEVGSG